MRTWKNKMKSTRGETIAETLVSLLIIVLAMTMLAGGIVSAAGINRKVKDTDTAFNTDGAVSSDGTVTLTHGNGTDSIDVSVYTTADNNAYIYYYEKTE